jgi:hypothetical protein
MRITAMTQRKTVQAVLDQDKPFTFKHENKTYRLPRADEAMKNVDGGAFMDMMLEDDERAQIRFALMILKNADVDEVAYAALRSKPVTEFSEVLGEWIQSAGVSLGE